MQLSLRRAARPHQRSGPHGFTAHNVRLADGSQTLPGSPLLADESALKAALRTLELTVPIADETSPPRIVDLGCLEGGYAAAFAQAGYEALGIEGREDNFRRCQIVEEGLALPNLSFAHDDVRNLRAHGEFDAVFCSGLLYHLDRPVEFIELLGDVARRTVLLNTHYATSSRPRGYRLSRQATNEGKRGRWYREFSPDADHDEVEAIPWASIGNDRSFWLDKRDLLQSIHDAGFGLVYEQFDFLGDIATSPYIEQHHRSLFVGVKL